MAVTMRQPRDLLHIIPAPSPGLTPPQPRVPVAFHWKCRDCGEPCCCSGDVRLLPHTPCGNAAERS